MMTKNNTETNTIPPVRKTIRVNMSVEEAFNLFTEKIHTWWPLDAAHSVGGADAVTCTVEGKVGGRIYETLKNGDEVIWGTIQAFDPPYKFATTWHPGNHSDLATYIEVRFSPQADGTTLELTHSGWEARGEKALKVREGYNSGWDFVLGEYLKHVV